MKTKYGEVVWRGGIAARDISSEGAHQDCPRFTAVLEIRTDQTEARGLVQPDTPKGAIMKVVERTARGELWTSYYDKAGRLVLFRQSTPAERESYQQTALRKVQS